MGKLFERISSSELLRDMAESETTGNFLAYMLAQLLALAGVAIVVAGSTILEAYVIAKLWLWFLVPAGVPLIRVAQVLGLELIFYFVGQSRRYPKDTKKQNKCETIGDIARRHLSASMVCLTCLAVGGILKLFMQ